MLNPEAAPLLYKELVRIVSQDDWRPREKVAAMAGLFERIVFEATRQEQLRFSTLFARLSYAGHQYKIQADILRLAHFFRRNAARIRDGQADGTERDVRLGLKVIAEIILVFFQVAMPAEVLERLGTGDEWTYNSPELTAYKGHARVVILQDLPEYSCFIGEDEDEPGQRIRIRYSITDRNENFDPTVQLIRKVFGFPIMVSLIDVEVDKSETYRPRAIVVEPDYLVDVSSISESFKENGEEPFYFLVKKFLPYEITQPLLLGNIVNFFLDRLLNEPAAEWKNVFMETFQHFPFPYAAMSDKELRDLSGKAQPHFLTLKTMTSGGFAAENMAPEHCVIEPAFFSEKYGIQGRLDLYYQDGERSAIVELKSSKPFRPNSYGIQRSHFTQTLLYDLLVRSVYGAGADPAKYILYSGLETLPLKFAPTIAPEQWEALQVRNKLVAIEKLLCTIEPGMEAPPVINRLKKEIRHRKGNDFLMRDYTAFLTVFENLTPLERLYFNGFTGFIAREQWIAKVGDGRPDSIGGHAALWRSSRVEKEQSFSLLGYLQIVENKAFEPEPILVFNRTEKTNPLANFRTGDIAVLYPAIREEDTVLNHQVIKCSILSINKHQVTVQLRCRQHNLKPFDTKALWMLEPDLMDYGFVSMYRSLFDWAGSKAEKRELLLGLRPPARPDGIMSDIPKPAGLTEEQQLVFQKIICSRDYFLLWGPPGTGKTSVMLRVVTQWILENTTDNILLLAYTNRAVDEICEALDNIGGNIRQHYLRIGSRFSTAEHFRAQLLSVHVRKLNKRADLRGLIDSRRIFVSTVASFTQNESLLKLKKFQRLVVDEASQLLEPQLLGLLSHFEHFILIGDHRQLPAVTAQKPETTRVKSAELNQIGLTDLRDSYFERMYRIAAQKKWDWAYAHLSHQGRMHAEIMDFPNRFFYNGLLKTLPANGMQISIQHEPLAYSTLPALWPELTERLGRERVVFWPVLTTGARPWQKTSLEEAEAAVQLVKFFKELFAAHNREWQAGKSLGIITPWRAQIAQLRAVFSAAGFDPDELTIDTVERYQGGARDVIIISCCVHSADQLAGMVSLSSEDVDRKLNVALTRARQHVIVLGNSDVLQQDTRYKAFIESYSLKPQYQSNNFGLPLYFGT